MQIKVICGMRCMTVNIGNSYALEPMQDTRDGDVAAKLFLRQKMPTSYRIDIPRDLEKPSPAEQRAGWESQLCDYRVPRAARRRWLPDMSIDICCNDLIPRRV